MKKQGLLLILSGPSGSGKGTIVEQLKAKDDFALSISATTRAPREYEQDGVHYFFRTREEFERMIANQELLEWAEFCGMKPLRSWQEKMGRSPLLIMPTIRRKLCSCVFAEVRDFLV